MGTNLLHFTSKCNNRGRKGEVCVVSVLVGASFHLGFGVRSLLGIPRRSRPMGVDVRLVVVPGRFGNEQPGMQLAGSKLCLGSRWWRCRLQWWRCRLQKERREGAEVCPRRTNKLPC